MNANSSSIPQRRANKCRIPLKIAVNEPECSIKMPDSPLKVIGAALTDTGKLNNRTNYCASIYKNLYISDYKTASDLNFLRENSFTHIVNCAASRFTNNFKDQFTYLSLELRDDPECELMIPFYTFIDFVEGIQDPNAKVLVHCSKGLSRAPAVVASYLIWKYKFSLKNAYSLLKEQRPLININVGFAYQLQRWNDITNSLSEVQNKFFLVDKLNGKIEADRIEKISHRVRPRELYEPITGGDGKIHEYLLLIQKEGLLFLCGKECKSNTSDDKVRETINFINILQRVENAPKLILFVDENSSQKHTLIQQIIDGCSILNIHAE